MATIDSLDIQISAQANKASYSIDKLVGKLNALSGAINDINVDKISSEFAKLSKFDVFSGINKSVKTAENAIGKVAKEASKGIKVKATFDASDYQRVTKQLSNKFSKAGAEIKFTGNLTQLEKQYQRLSSTLDRLAEKEQKIISVGATSPESSAFKNLQYDISATLNKMDILSQKIESFKIPQTEFRINGLTETEAQAEKLKSAVEELPRTVSVLSKSLNYNPDAMRMVFGEGAENIQNWSQAVNQFGQNAGIALNNFGDKSDLIKSKMEGFKNALNNLTIPPINETNLEKLQSGLSKTEVKLEELRTKLENGITMGRISENIGDSGFRKLQEQIKLTELQAEALKDKIKEVESASNQTSKFSGLSSVANRISNAFSNLGNTSSKTVSHIGNLNSGFKKLFRNIAPFLGIYEIFRFGKNAVETASDLVEVQNVVDATFGKYASLVDKMAETSIPDFGMSELTVKDVASRFQAMGTAMGFAQGEMANMSVELTGLAADMASFYNVEQADVAKSLESIFTGQARPLRQYGLDLTQATLQEWAMKQGLDADIQSMSQAEKTMLRYQYVLANTGAAQGDFARTANTWANQIRILKQQFQQFASVIGTGLIAAFKPFVQTLNKVMAKVISFSQNVLNALGQIFGWKFEISGGGITDDLGGASSEIDDSASGAGDLADNLGDAAKNAKKLKTITLGIDELNINAPDDDFEGGGAGGVGGGTGGGAGGVGAGAGLTTAMTRNDTLLKAYESSIKNLEQLGEYIGDALTKAMNSIPWDSVYEKARNFGKGLADFLNGLISPELFGALGRTIAGALNTAIYAALSFGKEFDFYNFGVSIATGINEFFKTFDFESLAETFNVWVDDLWEFIKGFISEFEPEGVFDGLKKFLGNLDLDTIAVTVGAIAWKFGAISAIKNTFLTLLSNALKGISLNFPKLNLNISGVFQGLKTALSGISAPVAVAAAAIAVIGAGIVDLWKTSESFRDSVGEMWNKISSAFAEAKVRIWDNTLLPLWGNIQEFIDAVKGFWTVLYEGYESSGLKQIFEQIVTFFGNYLAEKISQAIGIISVVFETVGGVVGGILEILTGAINFVSGVFSGDWSTAWDGIKQIVGGVANAIGSFLAGCWETITIIFSPAIEYFREKFEGACTKVKEAFQNIGTWFQGKWDTVKGVFKDVKKFFKSAFQTAYDAVKKIWNGLGDFFKGIAENAFKPIKKLVNAIISGVNWILEKVGSSTRFKEWDGVQFAKGSDGIPRNTIGMVNDQKGATYKELIVPPKGKPFIPEGRNVMLPLEKGTKIMPARQTRQLLENMPHFASGIGDFFGSAWEKLKSFTGDIWDYISEPGKIVQIAIDKFTDISGMVEPWLSVARGIVNKTFGAIKDYIAGIFDKLIPKVDYNPSAGVEQWRRLAEKALQITGQFSESNLTALLNQMQHESGGNPKAINNWDINAQRGTPSKGLMQVIDPTFRANALAPYDKDIYDPLSNMIAAIRYTLGRYGSLYAGWTARGYKGYASGIGTISVADLIPQYSAGGFPEDGLFYANHSELVGQFSDGRTAVANNEQIAAGIEEAAYRGFMRAMRESENTSLLSDIAESTRATAEKDLSLNIDGREFVNTIENISEGMGFNFRTGRSRSRFAF